MLDIIKCDKGFYPAPSDKYVNGKSILASHRYTINPGEICYINTGLIIRHQYNHFIKVVLCDYYEPLLQLQQK